MNISVSDTNLCMMLFQARVRMFCVLCEKRSFTEAAKVLNVSQSVVSRNIAELEDELKVSLFEHNVRPIRLTLAGQSLYNLLSKELDRINGLLRELRINNAPLAPLRVGFVESIARTMSWPVIEKIKKDYSTVSVLTGISTYLLRLLDHDQVDAIVCPDPFSNRNDLDRFFVFREPSIIILPKDTLLPQDLTWERLQFSGLPILQYSSDNSGGKLQQKFFNEMGLNFVHRVEVDINALILDYVAHGVGWCLTRPTTLLQHPALAAHVEVRAMPAPIASREVYVISRKGPHSQLAARMAAVASDLFRNEIAPAMVKITPWVAPYLYCAGPQPGDRIPVYPDQIARSPVSVFVL